jgi:hypothetical protein
MSMHLEGPWLTTTGKIRSKRRKYASAAAAQQSRDLREQWDQRQQAWQALSPKFSSDTHAKASTAKVRLTPGYPPGREPKTVIPSLPDTPGTVAARPADKIYTGTAMRGIGVLHKSNSVPIFTDEEAVDIAHMRR